MKAGIITFNSAHNYGASLQVYALQEYLKSKKIEVTIINYRLPEIDNVYKLVKLSKKNKSKFKKITEYSIKYLKIFLKNKDKISKAKKFETFIQKDLNTTKSYKNLRNLQDAEFEFDIMFAGSDQIWNSSITKKLDPAFFLEFGNKTAKRISYAASIGKTQIDEAEKTVFKRYLRNLDAISVREESAKDLLSNLTKKKISVVLDPTLLLDKEKYDNIKVEFKYNQDYIYVHNVHIKRIDQNLNEIAEKLSKETGVPIIHNQTKGVFNNELNIFSKGGPKEFIGIIDKAKYVVTNSFHATVFSILYQKNFITVPHVSFPDRMANLLNTLGLSEHLIVTANDFQSINKLKIDYIEVNNKLKKLREKSTRFLDDVIYSPKNTKLETYFKTNDKFSCYGCSACKEVCPTDAIEMIEDIEGFKYPVIDKKKCINCGLCEKKCIYGQNTNNFSELHFPKVYAAKNNNSDILKRSTSGGVFTSLFEYIINQRKGYVVGVKYNEKMEVIYDIAQNLSECKAFNGSKYVAADINDILQKVKKLLEEKKVVLFSGTPCQISGLKSYLGKEYKNLFLVELICHGVPSPKIFKKYINFLNKKYDNKISNFEFRNKRKGWKTPYIKITFKNGRVLYEIAKENNFNRAFLNNFICRPSCYSCEFTGNTKNADITIGDYWGIEKVNPNLAVNEGVSLIKVNNKKGESLLKSVENNLTLYPSTFEEAYRYNHKYPMVLSKKRNEIFAKIDEGNIDETLKVHNQFKNKLTKK